MKQLDRVDQVVNMPDWNWGRFLQKYATFLGMVLICMVFGLIAPSFLSPFNLLTILKHSSTTVIVAIGMTIVTVSGGLEMSTGATCSMAANIAAGITRAQIGLAVAMGASLAGIGIGILVGVVNAVLIVFLGITPFIATLGVMFTLSGIELLYNHSNRILLFDRPEFFTIGQGSIGPVPIPVVAILVITLVFMIIMEQTRLGAHLYGHGANPASSEVSGISKWRCMLIAYVFSGGLAGLAGVIQASYMAGSVPLGASFSFLVTAFTACFIGSTMFREGEMHILGTVISAIFLTIITEALLFIGTSRLIIDGIKGLILLLALAIYSLRGKEIGQVNLFG